MSKEIYISSTPHETRLAIVENDELAEIYYERENEYTLAGSIYNGRVTRVLPGMQSSFVDIGLERDAFLYITDFMEEEGDSADFESTHAGSGESRGSRNGDRNGNRGDRGDRHVPVTIEASTSALGEANGEGRSESSNRDQNGRSGRGRNRRGRGNRGGDRSQNGERSAVTDHPADEESSFAPDDEAVFTPPAPESDPVGEGAPGADGSRRWRGRRGRRRGRGGSGQPGEASRELNGVAEAGEAVSVASENENFAEYADDLSETLEAAPSQKPNVGESEPAQSRDYPRDGERRDDDRDAGRSERRGRNDRGGRDRGGRGDRGPRAPRGFAPSHNLYGVDPAEEEVSAPAEPIILPGESLSKYRTGVESEAVTLTASAAPAVPAGVILPRPATVIDDYVATSWDGGGVLPGETLSRRNRPDTQRELRRDDRAGYRQNPQQSFRNDPVAETQTIHDTASTSVAFSAEEQSEAAAPATHHEPDSPFAESMPAALDPIAAVPEPASSGPLAVEHTEQPVVHIDNTDYEPSEASASYRVDPAAPSEFRQSAPVIDEEEFEEEFLEEETPAVANAVDAAHGHLPETNSPAEEHPIHVDHSHPSNRLDEADAELLPAPVAELHAVEDTAAPAGYDNPAMHLDTTGVPPPPPPFFTSGETATIEITTIAPTGEMRSEEAAVAPVAEHAAAPAEPILHETSVVSEPPMQHNNLQSFAPGDGALEEELMDDDEQETATLHAHYDEEFDDLEEETLEGAADLGTMIREMSIDQITRTGDPEDEEDFEEGEAEDATEFEDEGSLEGDKPTEQTAADAEFFANTFREPATDTDPNGTREYERRPRREGARDNRRRDGRNRSRSTGGEGDRGRSGNGGRSRQSMQATNLPAISDLLKPGQEILVQIAKEPIAKKGARITSHIALPGRFLVFMPTVNHTGVSRKIESDGERRRLKEILLSEKGEAAGGFIVRTAASGASEEELRSDLRFLLNLWADIKQRSESSKSPALIYHDLNLVERILRDQVTDTFSAIWVDTETEYERVLRFLQRFQPSLIRRVKLYTKETPLFEQFGISEEINKALRSKVWLKSGGSIVINQTEALVAIDINTGKFVGKTARLEDTIVKTNLDAIPEIVRQIRLRDLGGIIIIDFIDMDERKNRNKVMAALEEELKLDRAPSKVLQFNDFGLVAITRKRVKQSLERTLSTQCNVCQGTGMTKSPITVCNDIYIEMRKMHKHLDRNDVMLRVHPEVVKQLKSGTAKWLQEMEEMVGKTILVKSDPSLHPEQFDIH